MAPEEIPLRFPPLSNPFDLVTAYNAYVDRGVKGWGTCWFLAAELVDRFYTSHGIELRTIHREGRGFSGFRVVQQACPAWYGRGHAIGWIKITGDIENDDENAKVSVLKDSPGENWNSPCLECLRIEAAETLDLLNQPEEPHEGCRHRHKGAAYCHMFRLAALFSLQHDIDSGKSVINDKQAFAELAQRYDPNYDGGEETPYFLFRGRHELLVSGTGDILFPGRPGDYWNFWDRHLYGEDSGVPLNIIEHAVEHGEIKE